jgi:hypothetical protein
MRLYILAPIHSSKQLGRRVHETSEAMHLITKRSRWVPREFVAPSIVGLDRDGLATGTIAARFLRGSATRSGSLSSCRPSAQSKASVPNGSRVTANTEAPISGVEFRPMHSPRCLSMRLLWLKDHPQIRWCCTDRLSPPDFAGTWVFSLRAVRCLSRADRRDDRSRQRCKPQVPKELRFPQSASNRLHPHLIVPENTLSCPAESG